MFSGTPGLKLLSVKKKEIKMLTILGNDKYDSKFYLSFSLGTSLLTAFDLTCWA